MIVLIADSVFKQQTAIPLWLIILLLAIIGLIVFVSIYFRRGKQSRRRPRKKTIFG